MKIKWNSLFILVNFFCHLTNSQKDEKEETKNITNTDTVTEKNSIDKSISKDPSLDTEKIEIPPPVFPCSNPIVDSNLEERCPSEIECDKLGNECLRWLNLKT